MIPSVLSFVSRTRVGNARKNETTHHYLREHYSAMLSRLDRLDEVRTYSSQFILACLLVVLSILARKGGLILIQHFCILV